MDIAEFVEVVTSPATAVMGGEAVQQQRTSSQAVFVAPVGFCQLANPLQQSDSDFVLYHKKFEGLVTPFDLPIECFPEFESMLDEDPGCVDTVNIMLRGAVAQSTASNYKSVVTRFHVYCMERGFVFPKFEASAVLRFVKDCHAEGFGLSFFQKLVPALSLLENVLGVESSSLTGLVKQSVNAIKRDLATYRGVVKKATGYSYAVIDKLVQEEIAPHWCDLHRVEAEHFISIFRGVIIYCTLCRFDDFSRLKDSNFTDNGNHVKIIFERSKNDQFGDNSRSVIPVREDSDSCPVRIIRAYFHRFGLQFNGSGKFVNFRLKKDAGRHIPLCTTSLSQSNATKCTRELLVKHGFDGSRFTEKSFKVQGVTQLLDSGEPLENVMVFGRWKRTTTPLHYRNLSENFLLGVAGRLPLA